jgi:Leucine-rich repeat (LRR) protein
VSERASRIEALLAAPSRTGWRRLCAAVDDLCEGELTPDLLSRWRGRLSSWPDGYRLLPGRWLRRLLEGEEPPGLSLVACLDAVLFTEPPRRSPYAWAKSPGLRHLAILRLYDESLGDEGAEALAHSSRLTGLSELSLSAGVTDRGALALASSTNLSRLRVLGLSRNRLGALGLAALVSSTHLAGLRALHLGRTPLDGEAIGALCQSRLPLARLDLDCTGLSGAGVARLCESGCLAGLTELNLSNNPIGREGCRALAACPELSRLEVLFLHGCRLEDEDVAALLSATRLSALRNLALSANALGRRSVELLAESELLSGLTELDVCHNAFVADEAERRLGASPRLAGVRRLCV